MYDFKIHYRRGINHVDADFLSGRPCGPAESDDEYERVMRDIDWLEKRTHGPYNEYDCNSYPTRCGKEEINAIMQVHGVQMQ